MGMIGLGRMGGNMVKRLLRDGHEIVAHARRPEAVAAAVADGATGASSLPEMTRKLPTPRVIWIMVPAGDTVDQVINEVLPYLSEGDILVDGGNSFYKDSMRRAARLEDAGIGFLDAGVSGGVWGLQEGYCLMVGGKAEAFQHVEPLLKSLAPTDGYARVGQCGAGHMVKMVHNGIEYGMLQAYAEGFELLQAKKEFSLDLDQIATVWQHGSVVRSWLLDLLHLALREDPQLDGVRGWVDDSGEGRWAVMEAIEQAVPLPVITESLFARFRSRQEDSFAGKVIAALRNQFGGHAVKRGEG